MRHALRYSIGIAALACLSPLAAVLAEQIVLPGTVTSLAREQQALRDARRQSGEARKRSEQLEAQAGRAVEEADKAQKKIAALAARIQESEAEIRAGQARLAILAHVQEEQAARLRQQREPAMKLLAAVQNVARRPAVLALLQPGSIKQAVHGRAVLSAVTPIVDSRTRELRTELSRSRNLRGQAELAMRAMRGSQDKLTRQQADLRRLEAEQRVAALGLQSNAAMEADRAIAMSEKARDIVDLLDRLEDAGEVRERLAALPGPVPRPAARDMLSDPPPAQGRAAPGARSAYRLPVVGEVVTGMGELSDSGIRARGLTLATAPSAQVVAPAAGRIAFAGPYRGFGQIVIIEHGGGWTTLLAHMRRVQVDVGQRVSPGDPVGLADDSDSHVTVELRRRGRPVDILALTAAG